MFLAYQPHIYERDRRRERAQNGNTPRLGDERTSLSSSSNTRRHSVDSNAASVGRTSSSGSRSDRHMSLIVTPSESDKANLSPSNSSSSFFGKLHLGRNKAHGRDKRQLQTMNDRSLPHLSAHDQTPGSPVPKGAVYEQQWSQLRRSTSTSPAIEASMFTSSWSSPVHLQSPTKQSGEIRKTSTGSAATSKSSPAPSRQSQSSTIDSSRQHRPARTPKDQLANAELVDYVSVYGFGGKPHKSKKKSDRPSTANSGMAAHTMTGFFRHFGATRSEQDLVSTGHGHARDLLPKHDARSQTLDDDNHEEVLTTVAAASDEGFEPEKMLDGLRISLNRNDCLQRGTEHNEIVDLSGFPLPVRLGLVHPSALGSQGPSEALAIHSAAVDHLFGGFSKGSASSTMASALRKTAAQYVNGYYLCTPPPCRRRRTNSTATTFSLRPSDSPVGALSSPKKSRMQSSALSSNIRARRNSETAHPSAEILRGSSKASLPPSIEATTSKAKGRWSLDDYFNVERVRRPGHFGVKERKNHAYSVDEAPYPFGYGPDTITSDILLHVAVAKSVELNAVSTDGGPPRRILDIGCGIGAWVMDMAKRWPQAEFVGLDLVPIQKPIGPDKSESEGGEAHAERSLPYHQRVSWVVANMLQGLPFPDASFDFIHIRFLNMGIPEQAWPFVLGEANRVLAPSGRIQILETDFSFFGSPMQMQTHDLVDLILGNKNGGGERVPVQHHRSHEHRHVRRNAALAAIVDSALQRRGINLHPSSALPLYLSSLDDVSQLGGSDPRHIPILARSHRKTFGQAGHTAANQMVAPSTFPSSDTESGEKRSGIDELIALNYVEGTRVFTSSTSSGASLPSMHLHIQDMDALRMAILTSDVLRYSDSRHLFWQEIENLRQEGAQPSSFKKQSSLDFQDPVTIDGGNEEIIKMIPPLTDKREGETLKNRSDVPAHDKTGALSQSSVLDDCLTRWPDFASLEHDLDRWHDEMQSRADIDSLFRHTMRWGDAAQRMDGWMKTERMRKSREKQLRLNASGSGSVSPTGSVDSQAYEPVSPGLSKDGRMTIGLSNEPTSPSRAVFNSPNDEASHPVAERLSGAQWPMTNMPAETFVQPDISYAHEEDDHSTLRAESVAARERSGAQSTRTLKQTTPILGFRSASFNYVRKKGVAQSD